MLRVMSSMVAVLIWTKSLYFMQLIDQVAPLVHIIMMIFWDIRFFIVTMMIAVFAFANAFYMLGKNQV